MNVGDFSNEGFYSPSRNNMVPTRHFTTTTYESEENGSNTTAVTTVSTYKLTDDESTPSGNKTQYPGIYDKSTPSGNKTQSLGTDDLPRTNQSIQHQNLLFQSGIHLLNITSEFKNSGFVTSATFSTVEVMNPPPEVGEYLQVRIIAKDGMNRPRTSGGDFWFAVMDFPSVTLRATTSSPVKDHQNGTYSVALFVGWAGAVRLNITLVHPSVAVSFLDIVRNVSLPSRVYWNGTFMNDANETSYTQCYMDYHGPNSWRDKCPYPNVKALGESTAWVCDAPPGNFTCENLVEYRTDVMSIGRIHRDMGNECDCIWLFDR